MFTYCDEATCDCSQQHRPKPQLQDCVHRLRHVEAEKQARAAILLGPSLPTNVEAAVSCLRDGGVLLFYSTATYGLAANGACPEAVDRIYQIKGRSRDKALCVLTNERAYRRWVRVPVHVSKVASDLIESFWPGDLGLILPQAKTPHGRPAIPHQVTAGLETVCIVAMDEPSCALSEAADFPIAVTSANFSGQPSITNPMRALELFSDSVDCMLLGPPSTLGLNTTIVDLCGPQPHVLREGGISLQRIKAVVPTVMLGEG